MQWIKIQYRTNYYFRKSLTSFCMYKTELLRAETIVGYRTVVCVLLVKVSKFQNEFLKSSFSPKYKPNIFGDAQYRAEMLKINEVLSKE